MKKLLVFLVLVLISSFVYAEEKGIKEIEEGIKVVNIILESRLVGQKLEHHILH